MEITAELGRSGQTGGRGQVPDGAVQGRERLRSTPGAIDKPCKRSAPASSPTSSTANRSKTIKRVNLEVAILIGVLFIAAMVYFFYMAQR